MLTDGHLKMMRHLLGELERLNSSMAVAAAAADVEAELHRRKYGPYSLSEAIASGRPFRRKDPNTNGKWMTASYLDTYDYADESDYNDYIAVDYELYPEGGEE